MFEPQFKFFLGFIPVCTVFQLKLFCIIEKRQGQNTAVIPSIAYSHRFGGFVSCGISLPARLVHVQVQLKTKMLWNR